MSDLFYIVQILLLPVLVLYLVFAASPFVYSRIKKHSSQDAMLMVDSAGRITYWDSASTRIFGYTEDEALGKKLHRLLASEACFGAYQKALARLYDTVKDNNAIENYEWNAVHRDGYEIRVALLLSAVKLQTGWHLIGIVRDSDDREEEKASKS